jgi:looped-hinge helix DNA binding domain, AbrB family
MAQGPENGPVKEVLTLSNRGQITLPAGMRKNLGLTPGATLIVEEVNGEIRLKPAAVVEIEHYSDDQITEWDRADQLTAAERRRILELLQQA